ncbi:MAG: hypothetical protein JWR77_1840 [Rhizorhabdus sp.]|nr:hypothetical protein [Rhizorhabdus sp.]
MIELAHRPAGALAAAIWDLRGDDRAVVDYVAAHIVRTQPSTIAVAGGETPRPILDMLRDRPLPWHRVTLTPTDERLVAPSDPASNYGMLSRALDRTPALIAPLARDAVPRFDLVWLGMAADGKIASLFSSADVGKDPAETIVHTRPAPNSGHVQCARVSLSLPVLASAKDIILVIRGHEKKRFLECILRGERDAPIGHLLRKAQTPVMIFWSA